MKGLTFKDRKFRLGLLIGLCILTILQVRRQWEDRRLSDVDAAMKRVPVHDSQGKVLGNPENAISDLRNVHKYLTVFNKRFKRYPHSEIELINDMGRHFRIYGLSRADEWRAALSNPDMVNVAGMSGQNPANVGAYNFPEKRFDGQPIGSRKPRSKRDVLASTSIYYFPNVRNNWDNVEGDTMNPVGFYVVLWDDGQIEKIPFNKSLYVPQGNHEWKIGFPSQAGLPQGTKTFDEFHSHSPAYQNWKRTVTQKHEAVSAAS